MIEIWQPKYSTNSVLFAKNKVREENTIIFTKTKSLEGKKFKISGWTIMKYPLVSNGRIMCYEVPMSELAEVGHEPTWEEKEDLFRTEE